jgi:hypothetical protein
MEKILIIIQYILFECIPSEKRFARLARNRVEVVSYLRGTVVTMFVTMGVTIAVIPLALSPQTPQTFLLDLDIESNEKSPMIDDPMI